MIIGYKAFILHKDKSLQSMYHPGTKYFPGETYEITGPLEICQRGFHYCSNPMYCFNFYFHKANTIIYRIEVLGYILCGKYKYCTNKIRILDPVEGTFTLEEEDETATFMAGQLNSIDDEPASVTPYLICWRKNNELHRENGEPAYFNSKTGQTLWYYDGVLCHTDDLFFEGRTCCHLVKCPRYWTMINLLPSSYWYRISGKIDYSIRDNLEMANLYKST